MFIDPEKRKAKERAQEFLGQLNDISEELNSIFKDHFPEATSQVRHYGVLDFVGPLSVAGFKHPTLGSIVHDLECEFYEEDEEPEG